MAISECFPWTAVAGEAIARFLGMALRLGEDSSRTPCGALMALRFRRALPRVLVAHPLMARAGLPSDAGFYTRAHRAFLLASLSVLPIVSQAQGIDIGHNGTPSYAYAINVPPGVAGMSPTFSIAYDASGTNGPVGAGWGLSGTSVITRCHGTLAVDGTARRGVANGVTDKLCLDGQRLIQTNESGSNMATANAVGVAVATQVNDAEGLIAGQYREFRTETDSFARIRAYGVANGSVANGPAYFKVWAKDGRIHEYGTNTNTTANATVTPVSKTVVIAWAVSRTSDRRGNYMDFQYDQRQVTWGSAGIAGREWNLMEVRYTGTATQAPTNRVSFVYDDRPVAPASQAQDRSEYYVLGSKTLGVRRLAKIQTYINLTGTPVKARAFKLAYSNGPRTNRSRLDSIAECVGTSDAICLPATRFEYAPGADESYTANAAFSGSGMATLTMHSVPHVYGNTPILQKFGVLTGDFNGDGKTDVIRWADAPAQNQLWVSNGDGTFTQNTAFNVATGLMQSDPDPCYRSQVADFDGDGLVDIFRFRKANGRNINGGTTSCSGVTTLYRNNGNGTFTASTVSGVSLAERISLPTQAKTHDLPNWEYDKFGWTVGETYYILDINGDGRLDIVTALLPFQEAVYPNEQPTNPCATVTCTRVFIGNGQGVFSEVTTNMANRTLYAQPAGASGSGQPSRVMDQDGDGLLDISSAGSFGLNSPGNLPRFFRSRGDGSFDEMLSVNEAGCSSAIDFNGDGRNECLFTRIDGSTLPYSTPLLLVSDGSGATSGVTHNFPYALAERAIVNDYGTGPYFTSADVVMADVDGDGRQDVIRWSTDPTANTIFLSNGDGTFRESTTFNLKSSANLLQDAKATAAFVLGDFTGRGQVEILRLRANPTAGAATSNQLYLKTSSAPADRLAAIVSGTGARASFTWVPLGSSSAGSLGRRYWSDRGTANAAAYPNFDAISPAYVVATKTTDAGVGTGTVATDYSYYGLKINHEGRGSLGFREVRRQGPGADGSMLTQLRNVAQMFPYIGVTSRTETWSGALDQATPARILRTQGILCDKTATTGAELSATVSAPCPSTAKIRRPYTYKVIEETWDLGAPPPAAAIKTVTTTNTVNNTGDPTKIIVSTEGKVAGTSRTFVKTADSTYKPDAISGDDWFLGRVDRTTLTNNVPNLLSTLTASAGTSDYASATTVTGRPVSVSSNSASTLVATKGAAAATGVVKFANGGSTAVTLTLSGVSAPYSLSSNTCVAPAAGSCSVTVTMDTSGTIGSQGTQTLTATGGNVPATATISGTLVGSSVALSSNSASSLSAMKGASPATGSVVFTNSGNQSASLTLSGLSSPYSFSPSSCSVVVAGTCSVTVSMATSGNVGSQGNQTLTATGGSNGPVTATVSGTLTGSSINVSSNGASALSASKGGSPATGLVVFSNSGNQSANLTLNGLSAPYSVSPNSCTAAAGGTCSVTVSMATSGSVGPQGNQTLTATGGSNGPVTAAVSGSLTGSAISVSSNGANALSAPKGGSSATGLVVFSNSGNQSANLTLSGLNAPYAVSPSGCTATARGNCSVTVSMATSGNVGSQGNQTLTATGGSNGPVTAAVSGTLTGSTINVSSNGASAMSAPKGGSPAAGAVVFSNSGNQSANLTLSGLSTPYSVSPSSCVAAAGGTCSVTVSMATGGNVGSQGSQTLTATGGTNGPVSTTVSGTLTSNTTTLSSSPTSLAFGSVNKCTESTKSLTLTNTGQGSATNLQYSFSIAGNAQGDYFIAGGGTCPASGGTLATSGNCTLRVTYSANTTGGSHNGNLNVTGNFPTLTVPLTASTNGSSICE